MRYFVATILSLISFQLHATNIGLLAKNCTALDPDESHIAAFLTQENLGYDCLDPAGISISPDLTSYNILYLRTNSEPSGFDNSVVISAINQAVDGGTHLILEYYGLYLGKYLDVGTIEPASWSPVVLDAGYFVRKDTDSPLFSGVNDWAPADVAQGNNPDQLIIQLTQTGGKSFPRLHFTVPVERINAWQLTDTPGWFGQSTNFGWCIENPGICTRSRTVFNYDEVATAPPESAGLTYASVGQGKILRLNLSFNYAVSVAQSTMGPVTDAVRRNALEESLPEALDKTPVLVIPGIFGSWSTEMFCGDEDAVNDTEAWLEAFALSNEIISWDIPEEWTVDPIKYTYSKLTQDLAIHKHRPKEFAYDWRLGISDIVSGDTNNGSTPNLISEIDNLKSQYDVDQIDIIAHSLGGLVVREYIQNHYRGDIRKFVMIATPNRGSLDVYPVWQKGNFTRIGGFDAEGMERILENMKQGCDQGDKKDSLFVRDNMPSVNQLLPTFDFMAYLDLSDGEHYLKSVIDMCYYNDYLINLNNNIRDLFDENIEIKVLASNNKKTLKMYKSNYGINSQRCNRANWPDRKPNKKIRAKPRKENAGDNRVLFDQSAYPIDYLPDFQNAAIEVIDTEELSEHGKLPKNQAVINSVMEFLNN